MSKWEEKRLEDIIDVNPPVKLKKGESYPFIDIDKVSPTRRSVTNEEVKVYDGQSSSKFCDGDTVFSRITPCLENRKIAKVSINGDAAFGSTEFYVFRAKKKKADARFTYYLTSSNAVVLPAINSMTGASGRQRADKRFIQRLNLKEIIDGKIRPEKIEAAQARINELLDQSVITAADARKYTITEAGKEIDLSKLDIDELRSQFKKLKNKNLEIANLRKYIEEKLQKMLRRNITRTKFAERFRNIIDEYNAGGSQNDDFYEKLLKLMEELRAEEERHIKEELSETELELFDLLRKEQLTVDEEKRVKLTAKELYNTLTEKRNELFIVGWQNDPQPKERVKGEIVYILNKFLPESYDREVFLRKSTLVFDHIVDQAMTGYNWVA
ncbi:MAG: type I restriction enzyme endonuclease domain-containing protein [Anaerobutyricum hallii]